MGKSLYRGQWLNGKRDGKGIEMRCNYQMIVGYFKEGEMHGPQTSISIWGTKTAVTYKNGQMEGPCDDGLVSNVVMVLILVNTVVLSLEVTHRPSCCTKDMQRMDMASIPKRLSPPPHSTMA